MLYGRTNSALPSRFLREIPEDLILKKGGYQKPAYTTQQRPSYIPAKPVGAQYAAALSALEKHTYLELNKGDMVMHTAFGRGLVLSVIKMGGDALLEIAFDQIGTKKLMAKTASAYLKRL